MATDPKKDTQDNSTTAQEAEGWRPEPGDVLTGTVEEVSKGWSDYTDSFYPIVTIQEKGTKRLVAVHCFHEILKQRMLDARPTVGSELEITCIGEKRTKDDKRSYVAYKVTVPGDTGERVWDDLGSQSRTAAASAAPDEQLPF